MTRSKLITVAALALVVFACSEQAGQMLVDAGEMMADAGQTMMDASVPDAGAQDTPAQCEKVASQPWEGVEGGRQDYYAATFDVNPGQTEVTMCQEGNWTTSDRAYCHRFKAAWYEGTSTGFWSCGTRYFDGDGTLVSDGTAHIKSITVHN